MIAIHIIVSIIAIIVYVKWFHTIKKPLCIISEPKIREIINFISLHVDNTRSNDLEISMEWISDDRSWRTESINKHYELHGHPITDVFVDGNKCKIIVPMHTNNSTQMIWVDEVDVPEFIFLKLGKTAKGFIKQGNAGGNSIISEAYSIDYFEKYLGGTSFVYENEVQYLHPTSSMVDFITTINTMHGGIKVGVSVTRATNYFDPDYFTEDHAEGLLRKKLNGLISSRNMVTGNHEFTCSILHIWAYNWYVANALLRAYKRIDVNKMGQNVVGNVGILISISDNWMIYGNLYGVLSYMVKF